MTRRWIIIFLLFVLVVPVMPDEKSKEPATLPLEQVIPGWKQIRSGRVVKGILLLGGFVGAITGALILNHRGNEAYDDYLACRDAGLVVDLRRETENRFRGRNWLLVGAAAIMGLHFLDLKLTKTKHATITGDLGPVGFRIGCRIDL